ncbi:MAG TPA: zinc ribbon domain-containing protein [Terriglobales bacterium]|nr:zinc ribbon domain-containing protein [Terriglobales bacterium]
MAFCNSCGANLDPGAKFCAKCGSAITGAPPIAGISAPAKKNDAVKIILIVVAVLIGLGIIGSVAASFIGYRIAKHTRITEDGKHVKVETPVGTVESSEDPQEAARNIGVDLYPSAQVMSSDAANVHVGGMHTVTLNLETSDPPEKVAEFYRAQLPHANVNVSDDKHYTIVSTRNKDLITVNISPEEGKTVINITNVSGKAAAGAESN